VTVQDDERERELVRLFNLEWDPSHQRAGVDAMLSIAVGGKRLTAEVEVKSTTGDTVSTARDVGIDHIRKWRRKFFVIGWYSKEARRPELRWCCCLTPVDMEPWIASIEAKILPDFKLAALASRRLELSDLEEVCGPGDFYTLAQAKSLHKQQWSADEYWAACDLEVDGQRCLSPNAMLSLMRLRARYVAERGATLNNPHITKSHLTPFLNGDQCIKGPDWAVSLQRIAAAFAMRYPDHPALQA
jgi:hypothetical protein